MSTPYNLHGPQVEPKAACWGDNPAPLHTVTTAEIPAAVPAPPPYPTGAAADAELQELHELARMRDDPAALRSGTPGRERRPQSFFLQLRPPALGAVYNLLRPRPGRSSRPDGSWRACSRPRRPASPTGRP